MTLRDSVLKPIIKRMQQCRDGSQRKKLRSEGKSTSKEATVIENKKPSGRGKKDAVSLGIQSLDVIPVEKIVDSCLEQGDLSRVAELKQEIHTFMKEEIYQALDSDSRKTSSHGWAEGLDRIDMSRILNTIDPIHITTEKVLSLPDTLSKIYNTSNFEVIPSVYHRDHVWLTLQWMIDGVPNPFMSRPCAGQPCLGQFILGSAHTEGHGRAMPEIVPLNVLDKMIEWTTGGMTLKEFAGKLREMRMCSRNICTHFSLGRDLPYPPRCLLCYVQDVFCLALGPGNRQGRSISLDTYKRCCMLQFSGLRSDILINFCDYGIRWILRETGVTLPSPTIPLPGTLVKLLECRENGEISVTKLYD